ncbi:hypothetical protein IGI04_007253 [Brassica rapa subsp. trilocularis]|uniref:Uncharacterized protein n=1 Tax=Brassica rapa subsp. trilocularis TaxID=1813537 RepID=A0ABQ7NJB2_BRACM|nr:hypothetical protein IGI04_007253 [Brassica rapa subsp. trilocularis]
MLQLYLGNLSAIKPSHDGAFKDLRKEINYLDSAIRLYFLYFETMLHLYLGNLSAIKLSHYGAFKDLRKEINYLDSAILLYFLYFGIEIFISCSYYSLQISVVLW